MKQLLFAAMLCTVGAGIAEGATRTVSVNAGQTRVLDEKRETLADAGFIGSSICITVDSTIDGLARQPVLPALVTLALHTEDPKDATKEKLHFRWTQYLHGTKCFSLDGVNRSIVVQAIPSFGAVDVTISPNRCELDKKRKAFGRCWGYVNR